MSLKRLQKRVIASTGLFCDLSKEGDSLKDKVHYCFHLLYNSIRLIGKQDGYNTDLQLPSKLMFHSNVDVDCSKACLDYIN